MAEQTLGAEPTAGAILADGPVTDGTGGAQIADRRSVLRRPWLAVLAAAGGAAALAGCDVTSSPFDRGAHLLRRLTYGANPAGRAHLRAVGEAAWLDDQLDPSAIDTHALDAKLAGFPALAMTVPQLYGAYPDNAAAQEALGQLRVAALIRAVESPAQLLERMVEFWSDHFNVTAEGRAVSLLKIVEDREVMRVHALGRFKDLLVADASSPAMLLYLDNYLSKVDAINENYGRELLELHTVGRDNGYTYDDIVSTARLFTGWTIDTSTGEFVFRPLHHDPGPITIMGWTRPSTGTGYDHGVDFLHWLAMQPRTATRVCHKLAVRFVGDDPDPGLVDAMANAWLSNDSRLGPVLRAMVAHPAFNAAAGKKFSRPWDYLAWLLRALDARLTVPTDVREYTDLARVLAGLGQIPFAWPAPDGYPDTEAAWLNTGGLLARWNLAGDVLASTYPPIGYDASSFRSTLDGLTAAEIYERTSQRLMLESVTELGKSFLGRQTGWADDDRPSPTQINTQLPVIAVGILASPDAQYR